MMYSMIPFGRYHGGLDTIFDDLERSLSGMRVTTSFWKLNCLASKRRISIWS